MATPSQCDRRHTDADGLNTVPLDDHLGAASGGYRALREGAAVVDLTGTTRVEHKGADALDLLNRLTTNDLGPLTPGRFAATVLTSEIGRVIDLLLVLHLEHGRLLLVSDAPASAPLISAIEKYTIIEDAELEDVSDATTRIAVRGPEAAGVVQRMTGLDAMRIEPGAIVPVSALGATAPPVRVLASIHGGYEFLAPRERRRRVWDAAIAVGATPAGPEAWRAVRIESGIPAPGAELTDRVNPLEAGLLDLISFTKGCYVGQEVIARLDTYDKVQRRLVGLKVPASAKQDDPLTSGGRTIGWITSVAAPNNDGQANDGQANARQANDGRANALGYVRNAHAQPGTTLDSESGQALVAHLP